MNPRTQDTSTGYLGPYIWYKTTSPGGKWDSQCLWGGSSPFLQLQRIGLLNSDSLRSVQHSYIYTVLYYYTHTGEFESVIVTLTFPSSLSPRSHVLFLLLLRVWKRKCKNDNLPCAFSYVSKRMMKKIWWDKMSCGGSWASRCMLQGIILSLSRVFTSGIVFGLIICIYNLPLEIRITVQAVKFW